MFSLIRTVQKYDFIFIDIDNTILNYSFAHKIALEKTSEKYHFSLDDYKNAKNEVKKRDLVVNHHKKEVYFKLICEMRNESFFKSLDMFSYYEDIFNENLLIDNSIFDMLKYAKANNKKVVAITDFYLINQIKKLKSAKLDYYIDYIVTSEEFEVEKPNVLLIEEAMKLVKTHDKSKIIMFGDSEKDDFSEFGIDYYPYNCSKLLISISGKSGAGKTTICNMLRESFSCEIIEGDGYHKYERNHPEWKNVTHYNPKANNLMQLGLDIKKIFHNISNISIPVYNHDNGKFNARSISDLDVVIIEGLHTLYNEITGDYVKIKIFIDNDHADNQKITRDIKSRNKNHKDVLDSINERKSDYCKYIEIQKQYSNFIISTDKDKMTTISISNELNINKKDISFKIKQTRDKLEINGNYCDIKKMLIEIFNSLQKNRWRK